MSGNTPGATGTVTIAVPPGQTLATPAATEALIAEVTSLTGQPPAQAEPAGERTFTADEIAAARRQEKDKLYPQLTQLEQRLAVFEQERAEQAARSEAAANAEAEERRKREEAELSAHDLVLKKEDEWKSTFNTAQSEWETKFNALQAQSEARAELLDRERAYQELQQYKSRRLTEEQENIMPELMDLVSGNTQEEIDSSIQQVVAKTSAIVSNIQQSLPATPQRPRGIAPVGATPSGPLENQLEQQTLTPEMIRNMSMDQYAQVRDRLLAAGSRR